MFHVKFVAKVTSEDYSVVPWNIIGCPMVNAVLTMSEWCLAVMVVYALVQIFIVVAPDAPP